MNIQDPIKTTVEEICKVLNIENVVGTTIETEDKLLIPITRIGIGFMVGMGKGKMIWVEQCWGWWSFR